jgi:histidinol-phosphatase
MSQASIGMDSQGDLHLAHRLADAADAISLARYQSLDLVIETKPDATPVTDADRAVEKEIRALLERERPSHLIIGEEFGGKELLDSAEPGTRFWIIDPIDGTKNFLRGVPTWATLIAMGEVDSSGKKSVTIGVVSSPAMGRRWWAERGGGAYVTERFASASPLRGDQGSSTASSTRRINVSKVSSLDDASLSYSDLLGWESKRKSFVSLLDEVWRTRALGDFLSHMFVAEGAVDIAAEPTLALWDMAALAVIVEEAGGRYSSLDGVEGPFGASGVSSNGRLHQEFLSRLSDDSER